MEFLLGNILFDLLIPLFVVEFSLIWRWSLIVGLLVINHMVGVAHETRPTEEGNALATVALDLVYREYHLARIFV